ncbi:MAG: RT0821/Lpp0805 family surface protein [Alphaproteobacteria bacterium]
MPTFIEMWRSGRLPLMALMVLVLAGGGALAEPPPWSTSAKQNAGGDSATHRCSHLGNNAAAINPEGSPRISGAIVGALVGGTIGLKMDRADQNCIGQSLESGDDGKTIWWENSAAKARFGVTPTRSFENYQGQYCREYRTTALVDGRIRQAYGTACQQADGAWEQVS